MSAPKTGSTFTVKPPSEAGATSGMIPNTGSAPTLEITVRVKSGRPVGVLKSGTYDLEDIRAAAAAGDEVAAYVLDYLGRIVWDAPP